MKKGLFLFITLLIIFISFEVSGEYPDIEYSELEFKISMDKISYKYQDIIEVLIYFKNISQNEIIIWPYYPISEAYLPNEIKFEFSGELGKYINNNYPISKETSAFGGEGIIIQPEKDLYLKVNLGEYYNIEEITESGLVNIKAKKLISQEIYENKYSGYLKPVGYISSNSIRMFLNMENELVNINIGIFPGTWNLKYNHLKAHEDIVNVTIPGLPIGYSVNDIKQDTILLNGVVKPAEVFIVAGGHNNSLVIIFSKKEILSSLGNFKAEENKVLNISGQLSDGKWFYGENEIKLTGE